MLHSLFMYYKTDVENVKATARCENFDTLKPLLQKRTWAIDIENQAELELAYHDLFKEIKRLQTAATNHYQLYLKNRNAVIKKIEVEKRTVQSEPLLVSYVSRLNDLIDDLLNFDAEIDVKFLKKLEETLQQEKAGFSQQSLFAFFQSPPHDEAGKEKKTHQAGVK